MIPGPADSGRRATSPSSDPSGPDEGLRASGVVHSTVGGAYTVHADDGRIIEASLRGRIKTERRSGDRVVIGDRVDVVRVGDAWRVEAVAARRTELLRRGPGGRRPKVVVANLDRVFVVTAVREPNPRTELVDRLLAVVEASGMEPGLVLNKVDLPGGDQVADELGAVYRDAGYDVLATSVVTGTGMDRLAAALCEGTSALIGPSGAGKSTLLNHVDPTLELRVGALSRKTGRGRHTTVSGRLVPLACGGLVADTPGFSDVGVWGVEAEAVEECFPEIAPLSEGCRFRGCAHVSEPDCAVQEAVAEGAVAESRYRSYVTLREEAREQNDPGR